MIEDGENSVHRRQRGQSLHAVQPPDATGLRGCFGARLKTEPLTRNILVTALSAHAMAGDREKAIAAGCDDYDTKPVELPRLLEKIAALLSRPSG